MNSPRKAPMTRSFCTIRAIVGTQLTPSHRLYCSYATNVTAVAGMRYSRRTDRPVRRPRAPSSAKTSRSACSVPLYFRSSRASAACVWIRV